MSNYAYYCLHKLKITPRQFDEMDKYEKAFIIASIQIKQENEEKEMKKMKQRKK